MRRRQRGVILVIALAILTGLVALVAAVVASQHFALMAEQNRIDQARARMAAEAGFQRAMASIVDTIQDTTTATTATTSTTSGTAVQGQAQMQTDEWYTLGDKGNERFLVGNASFRMEIVDAGSLVDINVAPERQLDTLPLTTEQVASLLDWRETSATPRTEGAKDVYYNGLANPYDTALRRFDSVNELLDVRYFTPSDIWQINENTTGTSTAALPTLADGRQPVLADLVTTESFSPQLAPSGAALINVDIAPGANFQQRLVQAGLSQQGAQAIQAGGRTYADVGAVVARVQQRDYATVLDRLTTSAATRVEGKINLNTATEAALMTLPNMTQDLAQGIVNYQATGFTKPSDLLLVSGFNTAANLRNFAGYFTVRSSVFLVRVSGECNGSKVALEGVVDTSSGNPRLVKMHDQPYADMPTRWGWATNDHDRHHPGGHQVSRESAPVGLAIEWSPRGVVAYDHTTRQTHVATDLPSLGLNGRAAVLALSRRGVFVRTARVPNGSPDEVRLILMMRVGDLFPLPSLDLAWDFALTDDVNDEGRLAILAAVPCADLRRTLEAAGAAGLRVKAAVPLAIGSTLLAQELGLSEAAVVERADDGPAVDVVSGGSLRASRAAPSSVPLELEVTRALGLAGLEDVPVVSAGGADVPGAARNTDRTALMALADAPLDRLRLKLELPEAVAARTADVGNRRLRLSFLVLLLSLVFAISGAFKYSDAKADVDRQNSNANNAFQKVKNDAKKATAASAAQLALEDGLKSAFSPAQKISDVLTVTTNAVPKGGAWLNSVSIERGKAMSIRGTSTQEEFVADFVKRLDTSAAGGRDRFRDVQLTNANNTLVNRQPVTIFVVQAFPVGNLPFIVKPGTKTTTARPTTGA